MMRHIIQTKSCDIFSLCTLDLNHADCFRQILGSFASNLGIYGAIGVIGFSLPSTGWNDRHPYPTSEEQLLCV